MSDILTFPTSREASPLPLILPIIIWWHIRSQRHQKSINLAFISLIRIGLHIGIPSQQKDIALLSLNQNCMAHRHSKSANILQLSL
jgi:hypothetical protein